MMILAGLCWLLLSVMLAWRLWPFGARPVAPEGLSDPHGATVAEFRAQIHEWDRGRSASA